MEEKQKTAEMEIEELFRAIDGMEDDIDLVVWVPMPMQEGNSHDK